MSRQNTALCAAAQRDYFVNTPKGEKPAKTKRTSGVTERLTVLSEMTRLRILRLLEKEEMAVGELAAILQMPQSTVSRHLKILLEGEWIVRRAQGTAARYRMPVDLIGVDQIDLWELAKRQLGKPPYVVQDDHRLSEVLAERRVDSDQYFGRIGGEWDCIRGELFGRCFADEALLMLMERDLVVADLGCGTGEVAVRLADCVGHVYAVDSSEAMLRAARKQLKKIDPGKVTFAQGDILDIPIEDQTVDIAIISLVLHHIDDPAFAVKEAWRILKPGGRVLIIDMLEHDRTEYQHQMGHRWLGFRPETVRGWLVESGFAVEGARINRLTSDPDAKGPELFSAVGGKGS